MEDQNNNEDYASVPDFLMPDMIGSKGRHSSDEQSVPEFDFDPGSPCSSDYNFASARWHGDPLNFNHHHGVEQFNAHHNDLGNVLMQTAQPSSTYNPPFLPPTFGDTTPLDEDESNPRQPSVSSTPSAPALICPVCCRTFKHKLSLTNHQRSHAIKQPHLCTICGETFKYKTNFKRHKRVHAREMRTCRYCGENMDSDYDLVQHEKEHRRLQKQL